MTPRSLSIQWFELDSDYEALWVKLELEQIPHLNTLIDCSNFGPVRDVAFNPTLHTQFQSESMFLAKPNSFLFLTRNSLSAPRLFQ